MENILVLVKRTHSEKGLFALIRNVISFSVAGIVLSPVIILFILLRPLLLIRIGFTPYGRIGHFAQEIEFYLCEKDAGLLPPRVFDIFFMPRLTANDQMRKMWVRNKNLRFWFIATYIRNAMVFWKTICKFFKKILDKHIVDLDAEDRYGIFEDSNKHLEFMQEEMETGEKWLSNMGIENHNYICFVARDSEYLEKYFPNKDWRYHDYRDVDIDTYIPALEKLAESGYHVFRMGKAVKKKMRSSHDRLIDYASNGLRNDFLDVYLSANCYFFLSNGTGIDSVARIFRRPTLHTDIIPLELIRSECSYDMFIPKVLWIKSEKRYMKIREILSSGVGRFTSTEQYEKRGLEIIHNTTEEIDTVISEMLERLQGKWVINEDDEKLQRKFWNLFKPSKINRVFRARIGAEFLRQHRELLD